MRRSARGLGVLLVGALALLPLAAPAGAAGGRRFAGANRFETAVLANREVHPSAGVVVLARGDDYPDALAGTYFASFVDSPLVFTYPDSVPPETMAYIRETGAVKVILLGGQAAIGESVAEQLRDAGLEVDRIDGPDRTATAGSMVPREDTNPDVFLGNGYGFADAVSAGPLANGLEIPVLLTGRDELPFRTGAALEEGNVSRIYAIGGREAISDEVLEEATRVGCPDEEPCRELVVRLGGADRYETSALVASYAAERFNRDLSTVHLVRGDTFPDALAAGVLAGKRRAVSLLTDPATLSGPTADWLRDHAADVMDVDVLGSPDAVADDVWDEARRLADG